MYHVCMAGENLQSAAAALDQLRSFRARQQREVALGEVVGEEHARLKAAHKHLATIIDAWRCVVPDELLKQTKVRSFSRGKLIIAGADASVKFRLENWLRGGGRSMLAGCAKTTIRDIVIKVGIRNDEN